MSDPFMGEIRAFAFDFPPKDWVVCEGQMLSVSQYGSLYAIMGTRFGGDGVTTFGVPDLRGRAPMHFGSGPGTSVYPLGQMGGHESIPLTTDTMPNHSHSLMAIDANADSETAAGNLLSKGGTPAGKQTNPWPSYADGTPNTAMAGQTLMETGLNQAHENRQPFLVLNFCLSLAGLYPKRPSQQ